MLEGTLLGAGGRATLCAIKVSSCSQRDLETHRDQGLGELKRQFPAQEGQSQGRRLTEAGSRGGG